MQTFRERNWSLSYESDSKECGKLGVPELKLVLRKIQTQQSVGSPSWKEGMKEGVPCIWSNHLH